MKNPFKKSNTLYYAFYPEADSIITGEKKKILDSIITPSTRALCPWYTALTVFSNKASNIQKYWEKAHSGSPSDGVATAKVCPAVQSSLDNSMLIKTPCDLAITVRHDGSYVVDTTCPELLQVSRHNNIQLGGNIEPFKGKIVLKIHLPMLLSSGGKYPYIFLQPHYHNDVPFSIINGIVPPEYSYKWSELNIVTLFALPEEGASTHILKKGTVLAYLWSTEPLKLKEVPYTSRIPLVRKKFIRGY